jgi:lysophospholipase
MSYFVSQESNVSDYPNTDSMMFFAEKVSTGVWKQTSGVDIFYGFVAHEQASQCVVISSGRSESVIKYAEFIHELYQNGYSVFIIDHQGQGQSSRLLNNPHIGYVNTFDDYVEDLKSLINNVLNPFLIDNQQASLPKTLLCHSMGGAIGALYVQKYPLDFSRLILCSPMLGILMPLPLCLTKAIVKVLVTFQTRLKLPARYFWGQANYQSYPFHNNSITNSETRYRVYREMMANYPQNQLGGISPQWLLQAINGMSLAMARANKITLPTLVFQAAEDRIVDNEKITQFVKELPHAELIIVPNAKHELLFEKNEPRTLVVTKILDFLSLSS